jgi:hypothetical protein
MATVKLRTKDKTPPEKVSAELSPALKIPSQKDQEENLLALRELLNDALTTARQTVISSMEDAEKATSLARGFREFVKTCETQRKEMVDPLNKAVKEINSRFKVVTEKAKFGQQIIDEKVLAWHQAQLAREQETAAQTTKLGAVIHVPVAVDTGPIRADDGSLATTRSSWVWEVVDVDQVPREYLSLDEVKVNAQVRAGIREIPGLRIFEKQTLIVK